MQALASVTAKPYKGWGMNGAVAKWYARLTKKSLKDFTELAERMATGLSIKSNVLEVAPGPGYFAIELAKLGDYRITGLDISETLVEIARANAANANVRVDFRHGNAANMPFDDELFDFLICRAAFKNFADPIGALQEMYRVLKPGGRALIIDLRRDASHESIAKAVEAMHLGPLNQAITKLTFRFMLLKRAYTKDDFDQFLAKTRFRKGDIREDMIGLEVWLRKPADEADR
jgi:ubiquinone/menaquinone biosynthesis C-methylase UbiE